MYTLINFYNIYCLIKNYINVMEDINWWELNFKACCYSDRLLNKLLLLNEKAKTKVDIQEIKKAIYYARKYHGDQKRQSGEHLLFSSTRSSLYGL